MAAKHPNKHIRAAIRDALDHGWTLKISGGHAFGRLLCPNRCHCQFSVWSTPSNPEKHARWIQRQIARCPLPVDDDSLSNKQSDRDEDAEASGEEQAS